MPDQIEHDSKNIPNGKKKTAINMLETWPKYSHNEPNITQNKPQNIVIIQKSRPAIKNSLRIFCRVSLKRDVEIFYWKCCLVMKRINIWLASDILVYELSKK